MEQYFTRLLCLDQFIAFVAHVLAPSGYFWGCCVDGHLFLTWWLNAQLLFDAEGSKQFELCPRAAKQPQLGSLLNKAKSREQFQLFSLDKIKDLKLVTPSTVHVNHTHCSFVLVNWNQLVETCKANGFILIDTHCEKFISPNTLKVEPLKVSTDSSKVVTNRTLLEGSQDFVRWYVFQKRTSM
jgi:hypothetical protein